MGLVESTYDYLLRFSFAVLNPVKKSIIKTECIVHQYINMQALIILENDKYMEQANLFRSYITHINDGTVWADQSFKSTGHFYNPRRDKGLYGRTSAMELALEYYDRALSQWNRGDFNKSLFYLGAALHLVQDMTIPQHANVRLLDNHHQYENYVKQAHQQFKEFKVSQGPYLLDTIDEYIRFNGRVAMKIYKHFKDICDNRERYYKITKCALPLAQRTTAGGMLIFYRDVFK